MTQRGAMSGSEVRAAWASGAIMSLRMLGLFMVYPLLVPYARGLPGSDAFLAGMSLGIYGLTQGSCQIPFGILSDRWGRKRGLVLGFSLLIVGSAIAALWRGIVPLLIGRALQGAGAIGSIALAAVGDRVREEHRAKAMGIVGGMIGGSFVLALLLGPVVAGLVGVRGLFGLVALLALLALIALVPGMPGPPVQRERMTSLLRLFRSLLRRAEIRRHDYGIFVQHAGLTLFFMVFPTLLITRWGLGPTASWRFYVPVLIGALLVVGPLIPRLERGGRVERAIPYAVGASGLALTVSALATNRWLLAGAVLCYFVAFTLLETLLPANLSRLLPPENRGAGMGMYSSAQFLGIFVGGVLGGLLLPLGARIVLGAAALLLWSWLLVRGRSGRPSSVPAMR